jgi:DHA2 family multidrug resistance protein
VSDGRPEPLKGGTLAITALALALGTFMQVLDLTIANVSLPTIAGNLGVSSDSGTWIITSFAVANGISVPLTAWLMGRYGVVRVFTLSVAAFTVASLLCGIAWNLPVLIFFRVLQGGFSGPMIPGSQALLIAIFPPEKRGTGLGIWSITTLVAPIAGPVLGGYISDNFHWGWIFLINIPVGLFVALVVWRTLRTHETPTRRLPIDKVGLGLLFVWVGALQVVLDLGKNADWFHDPLIVVLASTTAIAFLAWLIWELTDDHPIVDLSLVFNRNFLFGSLALCFGFAIYFGNIVLLPLWLQTQLGYTATWAGLAVAPSGIVAVLLTPLIARLMAAVDIRWIATLSFGALVASYLMRAGCTTNVTFATVAIGSAVQGVGASGFFLSLLTILLDRIPPAQVPSATGLSNFVRIVLGSFATSITTTLWDRREALHQSHLVESATAGSPSYIDVVRRLGSLGLQGRSADAAIQNQLVGQGYLLSTTDLYWAFALLTGLMILFVWLTQRAKGGHAAAAAE